jgi:multidrug efflux pump subunit AcrB
MQHYFNLSIGQEQIRIYGSVMAPAGKAQDLSVTRAAAQPIEARLKNLLGQGVDTFTTVVGQQWRDGRREQSPELFQIVLQIGKDHPHPTELKAELLPKVRNLLEDTKAEVPAGRFHEVVAEERKRGQENFKKDMVTLRVEGELPVTEEQLIAAVRREIKLGPDETLSELVLDQQLFRKSWRFEPNPDALMSYGLSRADLAQQLSDIFAPVELSQVRLGGEMVSILTRVRQTQSSPTPDDFISLGRLEIRSPAGSSVPLDFLGRWSEVQGLQAIRHENGVRVFDIDFKFNTTKANAELAKASLNQAGAALLSTFPGLKIQAKDANQFEAENRSWTLRLAATCIGLILVILFVVLGSFTQPLLVTVPIAMGISGALWALYFHGHPLTLMAMIGILGLIGVAVNDSLVMVYSINELKSRGDAVTESAIIHGASSRLRAIFLVSVTSWVGVFPTAYGLGGESGFTQPIAFAMGWGLFTSTTMTLFLLPALLMVREDLARGLRRLWAGVGLGKAARRRRLTPLSAEASGGFATAGLDFVEGEGQKADSPLDSPPPRQ